MHKYVIGPARRSVVHDLDADTPTGHAGYKRSVREYEPYARAQDDDVRRQLEYSFKMGFRKISYLPRRPVPDDSIRCQNEALGQAMLPDADFRSRICAYRQRIRFFTSELHASGL